MQVFITPRKYVKKMHALYHGSDGGCPTMHDPVVGERIQFNLIENGIDGRAEKSQQHSTQEG